MREKIYMAGKWQFMLDPENMGIVRKYYETRLPEPEDVIIPHTYNVGNGTDRYRGAAWYQYVFTAPMEWSKKVIRIKFNGIYRDADLWLNGISVGKHYGAGFTTFMVDVTAAVKEGSNLLAIRVDNSYSPYALPWFNQFDWADDGGIYRPAYIVVTEKNAIESTKIDAIPVISGETGRVDDGPARLVIKSGLMEQADKNAIVTYELVDMGKVISSGGVNKDEEILIDDVRYWHFDAPELYTLRLSVTVNGLLTDCFEKKIGFRSFSISGCNFVLNGEKINTVGAEWMPGSDPRIGNAERPEDIGRYLKILKDANCIYTRVHWQQDDSFYDWCDEHGMMVQEEVPLWGMPKEPVGDAFEMVKAQYTEMIRSHYDHPSIVTWGVGNELNGQSDVTRKYVYEAVNFFRIADQYRPISYVSNTAWESVNDANTRSDIQMCNEYIGTWQMDLNNENAVREFREANADKPMLISEFGLCEPAFSGGDERRQQIILDKIKIYRNTHINGFIYFCLNDYRTQMGEDGEGRFRQRVHGSTDMFGIPKPSYETLKNECSPVYIDSINVDKTTVGLILKVRNDLPCYSIKGYYAMMTAVGVAPSYVEINDACPGDQITIILRKTQGRNPKIYLMRPNGDVVLSVGVE